MSGYIKNIIIHMDFNCGVIHADLNATVDTTLRSIAGVEYVTVIGAGYDLMVNYGTYSSYSHDEYMRFIDDTRRQIEDLSRVYSLNKSMYEVL